MWPKAPNRLFGPQKIFETPQYCGAGEGNESEKNGKERSGGENRQRLSGRSADVCVGAVSVLPDQGCASRIAA